MRRRMALILACGMCLLAAPVSAADQNPQAPQSVEQKPDQSSPSPQSTNQLPPIKLVPPKPLEAEVDYWIDPDRPHIADSSVNVPKGLMLQENGFQQLYATRKTGTFDFPETLMRLGITDRTELRFNAPNFFSQSAVALNPDLVALKQRSAGFENMQAGFKRRLGPLGPTKFQIAVNPYISIPTGFNGQSSRVDPNIKFPFSQELNEHWDIEGMQSLFDPTGPDGHRNLDWQTSLVLNRSWGRQKNVFIEYVGDVFQHGHMSNIIHFGAAYRPTRRQQIDTQFGFRMNNAAPIAFFGFGYSFLLGRLNTPRLTPSLFKK
jgi:Putative MetA-pathway of phenol degradation